jgi:hypothetical protein
VQPFKESLKGFQVREDSNPVGSATNRVSACIFLDAGAYFYRGFAAILEG